jgi:hypothetical protein
MNSRRTNNRLQTHKGHKSREKSVFEDLRDKLNASTPTIESIESDKITKTEELIPYNGSGISEVNSSLIEKKKFEDYKDFRYDIKNILENLAKTGKPIAEYLLSDLSKVLLDRSNQKEYPPERLLKILQIITDSASKLSSIDRIFSGKYSPKESSISHNSNISDEELEQKEMELASILGKSFTKREIKITETSMGGNGAQS